MYGKLVFNNSTNSNSTVNFTQYTPDIKINAESNLSTGFVFGFDVGGGWALELSYLNSVSPMKQQVQEDAIFEILSGSLIFTSTMFKSIYSIQKNNTDFYNPYIGFGFGHTDIHLEETRFDNLSSYPSTDGSASTMQLTFGNRFKFNQGWFGDIAANYTRTSATTLTSSSIRYVDEEISASRVTSMSFSVGKSF